MSPLGWPAGAGQPNSKELPPGLAREGREEGLRVTGVRFGGSAGAGRGPARAAPATRPGGRRGWKSRRWGSMQGAWGGWRVRVGARKGGGGLDLACHRPEPGARRGANNGAGGGSDRAARSSAMDQGEMGMRECTKSSRRCFKAAGSFPPPLLAGGTRVRHRRAVRHGTTQDGSRRGSLGARGLGARGLGTEHVGACAGGMARCASARRRGTASTGWKNFRVPLFERVKLQKVE
jgi:hypothetical protein